MRIQASHLAGLALTLLLSSGAPAASLGGRVEREGGAPLPADARVEAVRVDDPQHAVVSTAVREGGSFELQLPAGIYLVRARNAQLQACAQSLDVRRDRQGLVLRLHPTQGSNPTLAQELLAMAAEDQRVREAGVEPEEIRRVDQLNTERMTQLLKDNGWPRAATVGCPAVRAAWLLVQHTTDLLLETVSDMEQAAEAGELPRADVALSIDRVRLYQGRRQLYGSQLMGNAQGRMALVPIEDRARVDERRAAMGMESLKEYLSSFPEYRQAAEEDL